MAQTSNFYRIGKPFIQLDKVESTNNYAMGLINDGMASHGTVVYTENQTRGKGQRNKIWISGRGDSLTMSVIIRPEGILRENPFSVIATTAISCYKLLKKYLTDNLAVKWPNDLFFADKKAGGILVESKIRNGSAEWMVIGIGINLNQNSEELLPSATSLKNETGKQINVLDFAHELIDILNEDFLYVSKNKSDDFIEVYNRLLYCRNKRVKLIYRNNEIETVIRKVSITGELFTDDGNFIQGDIQWTNLPS